MTDALDITHERQVADLPEARRLIDAICKAMLAYRDFLDEHGMIWKDLSNLDPTEDTCKAEKLIAEINFDYPDCGEVCDIRLIGGALDRAYSDQPTDDEGKPKLSH
jgi:hypothetical protein